MLLGRVLRLTSTWLFRSSVVCACEQTLTPRLLLLSKQLCFTHCKGSQTFQAAAPQIITFELGTPHPDKHLELQLTARAAMQPACVTSDMAAVTDEEEEDADEGVTTETRVTGDQDQLLKCEGVSREAAVAAAACDEDCDEGLDGQEGSGMEDEDVRATMDANGNETQETEATAVALTAPDRQRERQRERSRRRRKMHREKKKMLMKMSKLPQQTADSLDSLMSELPFAFASSAVWTDLGFAQGTESTEKRKRKRKRGQSAGRVDSDEDTEKTNKKKKQSYRPNYFVSIPITNTQISSAVAEIQEAVLQQEPRFAKAMIPVPSLHITLLVTHLANQEQIDTAAAALAQLKPSLAELLCGRDLALSFSGIGHFRKEVVYMDLAPGWHRETLDRLSELLRSCFEAQGLMQGDRPGFEPHLTIMKLSRAPRLRSQGLKKVEPDLYSNYTDRCFGEQPVERLDLCSMLKKKQQNGYYHTETSLQLDLAQNPLHAKRTSGRRRSAPDEAELLKVSKRLVEDAVGRALQQYKQETLQNGGGPKSTAGGAADNTTTETPSAADTPQATGTANKSDATANSATDTRK